MSEQEAAPEEKHKTFVWKIFERRFEVSCDGQLFVRSSSLSTLAQAVADMLQLSGKGPVAVSVHPITPASGKVQ